MTTENTTPAPEPTLAERMYAAAEKPMPRASTPAAPSTPASADPAPVSPPPAAVSGEPPVSAGAARGAADSNEGPPQMTEDEFLDEERSLADRMADASANIPREAAGYEASIRGAFETVEHGEAEAIGDEEARLLSEGRAAVSALLHEMAVPANLAKDVSNGLAGWRTRDPLDDAGLQALEKTTTEELRAEWGPKYDAKVRMAQRAAREAMQKLPWLEDLIQSGAGNDPKLIRDFAKIGERNARRARAKR